jgi:hypothetical protein
MKSAKFVILLSLLILPAMSLFFSSCGKCTAPTITFNPSSGSASKTMGEKIMFDVTVTGKDNDIKEIVIKKTINGSTSTINTITNIGGKEKTVNVLDSVSSSSSYDDNITYTVTATSDCKKEKSAEEVFTVIVVPSSLRLDSMIYQVKSNQGPRLYSRLAGNTLSGLDNTAWDLQNRAEKYKTDASADKDICDSCITPDPFTANVRWGSRNGSKFVKAPGFDYFNASAQSIINAYKAGTPVDLFTFSPNDCIIVNIKNQKKYAVIFIRSITEDGSSSSFEDYTLFKYKLAQ